jgi:hypothetical protein
MKNHVIKATILILIISGSLSAQIKQNDLEKELIIGKVKSMVQIDSSKYEYRKTELNYNEKGFLVKNKNYWMGKLSGITDYKYDAKGYLVEEKETDTTGKTTNKKVYLNDIKGNVSQITTYWDGSSKPDLVETFKRDVKGNIINKTEKDPGKNLITKNTTYKIDIKGNVIEESTKFNGGNFMLSKYKLTYNANGLVEIKIEESSSNMTTNGPSFYVSLYKYNPDNKLIAICYEDGTPMETYDDKGNLLEDNDSKYQYEFDATGNWIRKTQIQDGKIHSQSKRIIEYY